MKKKIDVELTFHLFLFINSEGYQVLFKVALTIIKMNEHGIWALEDPIDVFPLLQNMPRKLMDCHKFMEVSFPFQHTHTHTYTLILIFIIYFFRGYFPNLELLPTSHLKK
jgi:hypothetical protein